MEIHALAKRGWSISAIVAIRAATARRFASTCTRSTARAGFGTKYTARSLKLTAKLPTRLNKKLRLKVPLKAGQPLGSLRFATSVRPAPRPWPRSRARWRRSLGSTRPCCPFAGVGTSRFVPQRVAHHALHWADVRRLGDLGWATRRRGDARRRRGARARPRASLIGGFASDAPPRRGPRPGRGSRTPSGVHSGFRVRSR